MVAGGAIFALYEVSTALSVREQKRLEAAGAGPVTKITAKVRQENRVTEQGFLRPAVGHASSAEETCSVRVQLEEI